MTFCADFASTPNALYPVTPHQQFWALELVRYHAF